MDELITCGDTEIAAANIRIAVGRLNRIVHPDNVTGFAVQFEVRAKPYICNSSAVFFTDFEQGDK